MRNILLVLCLCLAGCSQRPPPPAFLDESITIGTAHYHWEHFPIHVRIPTNILPRYRDALIEGILTWNILTNREIFVIELVPKVSLFAPPGTVTILFAPLPLTIGGITWDNANIFTGNVENSLVAFNSMQISEGVFWAVAVHEMGHVLGLAHDEDTHSIMFPTINEQMNRIEPEDIEYVNYQYDRSQVH